MVQCYTGASSGVWHAHSVGSPVLAQQEPAQARKGAAALAELFEEYYDRIARYIAVRIGNRDDAEEMAGEVFLRALEAVDTFQWRGIPMHAWLFRIAHNLVVDYLRRHTKRRSVPLEEAHTLPSASDPPREAEIKIQSEEAFRAMERLTPAQQEVLTLRLLGGLSAAEAGQLMGRTEGAVRELQRAALRTLRGMLNPQSQGSDEPR